MRRKISNSRDLALYRLERARATLQDARNLFLQNGTPSSIVNRSYYSMFYAALALLAPIGEQTSKHQGVLALFDLHFMKTKILPKEMGKFLHKAFDMRQTGDYEEEIELTLKDARDALDFAEMFVRHAGEKILKES